MKLFVNNLPPSTRKEELRALFSRFGTVTQVTLLKRSAHLDSCGVLDLSDPVVSAARIAEQVNRTVWKNRRLDVFEPAALIESARQNALA